MLKDLLSKIVPISEINALVLYQLVKYLTIFTEPIHLQARYPSKHTSNNNNNQEEKENK